MLRRYWQTCRPRQWLFGPRAGQPRVLHVQLAQRTYCRARDAAGIAKVGGIHTLRHCYATHLLEPASICTACSSGWATTT